VVAHFVDIGGIVDHHFLNFLFIMNSYVLPFITLLAKTQKSVGVKLVNGIRQ